MTNFTEFRAMLYTLTDEELAARRASFSYYQHDPHGGPRYRACLDEGTRRATERVRLERVERSQLT